MADQAHRSGSKKQFPRYRSTAEDGGDGAVTVLLVTDVRLLREGLAQVLAGAPEVHVVGTAATRAEAVDAVERLVPRVVLLDTSVPHCVEIGSALHASAPAVGIVAFASDPDESEQVTCVEAGITGFVPRDGGAQELIDAVIGVARGNAVCSPKVVARSFRRLASLAQAARVAGTPAHAVSARELEIVGLIDRGLSNKEIAQRLDIGVATVKNHVHHILEKLQVGRRGEAAAFLRDAARRAP
jgi:DNA-binding NarL/FixJ family response regulator